MCGITGFTGRSSSNSIHHFLEDIEHRGRDEIVTWSKPPINLGMTRLAIVDLTPNLYPMMYKNLVLIFNGEIYNTDDLKSQLKSKNITWKTKCDAEVILPSYYHYGPSCFSLFEGMFAIAIYDTHKQQLILARDKNGEKPLYYTLHNKELYFSSEMKSLLKIKGIDKTLNHQALSQYFQQGYIFSPDTLINNIHKIPAGHYLHYSTKKHQSRLHQYWDPQSYLTHNNKNIHQNEVVEHLDTLLNQSVKSRLMGDVPFGCFLSGGIDSSLVTHYAAKNSPKLKTFSISFPHNLKNDESYFSKKIAKLYDTEHQELVCTPKSIRHLVDNIGQYIDEPISDPACLPTYLLAKEARKSVKFVLTGEGADEIFGGYHRYWKMLLTQIIKRKPILPHYNTQQIWTQSELLSLLSFATNPISFPKVLNQYVSTNPLLAMQLTDLSGYLPDQLFHKVDRMTMINNLESRAPYLDSKIVQFGLNLPQNYKIRYLQGKYLLKKVAQKYFPKTFVWRPKHGFTLPLAQWFRNEFKDEVEKSLDWVRQNQIFNHNYYSTIITQHQKQKANHADKIWSVIVLSKWIQTHNVQV